MAHHLFITLSHFFARYGYWTVFGAALLENTGIPAPGAVTLVFAGFVARSGNLHLWLAVVAAIAGATLGECIGFTIGRLGGEAFIQRHRKKLLISPHVYDRSRAVFLRYAPGAILAARFISGLKEIVGILAGVFQMSFRSFFLCNFAGAVIWSIAIGLLGYFLGGSWRRLVHLVARVDTLALVAFLAVISFLAIRSWLRRPERR